MSINSKPINSTSIKKTISVFSLMAGLNLSLCATVLADTMQDAQKAFDKKEYSTAVIHLKNQLKETPDNAQARFLLGKVYLNTGKLDSSIKELGRAHEYDAGNTEILFLYADALQASAKYDKMLKVLSLPLKDNKQESNRLSYLGYAHLGLNHQADARAAFEKANQLHKNAIAFNGLANLALLNQELSQGEQLLAESLAIDPNNQVTLQLKAKLANINKQHEAALKIYDQLVKTYGHNPNYRVERAATLTVLKKNKQAMADVDVVLKRYKEHPQANYIKAQILFSEKDFEGAKVAAQTVVNNSPRHMPASLILGASNYALKNYNQAVEYLIIYLSSAPSNLKAQNLLANVYLDQGKIKQTLLILEGIPEENLNKDPMLLMTLGMAYIHNNETDKGIQVLTQAQQLDPNNQDIRKRLIAAQFQSGDMNDAISELETLASSQKSSDEMQNQTQYLLIISYLKQQQLDKADEIINELQAQTPDDTRLLNLKALAEQLRGNSDKAVALYQKILKQDENNIPAYMGLARIAAIDKNWPQATEYFNKIITINPETLKAYLGLAAIAEKQNQPELTEKYFLQAIEKSNKNLTSQLTIATLMSQWYQSQKQPEKILALAKDLEIKHPNNNNVQSFLAHTQLLNQQTKEAEKTLVKIISFDKQDVKHRILLAKLISQNPARINEALELLDNAHTMDPENETLYTLQAALLIKSSRFDEAIAVAKTLQKEFPDSRTGKLLEADIYRAQKQYEKALYIYQSSYQKDADKKVLLASVDMLLALKQDAKAIELLNRAIESDPDDIDSLLKLASLHQQKNQLEQAEKFYKRILNSIPNHIISLNNLSWIYMDHNSQRAVQLSRKAHEIVPNSAAITDTYGFALLKDKQYQKGKELLIQAAQALPDDHDIQYHLAFAYDKTGEKDKALEILETIANAQKPYAEQSNAQQLYKALKK